MKKKKKQRKTKNLIVRFYLKHTINFEIENLKQKKSLITKYCSCQILCAYAIICTMNSDYDAYDALIDEFF